MFCILEAATEKRKLEEKNESPNSSINLTSTDDEQRSPSKSPTPRRRAEAEDTVEARLDS
jgi:hypothetical protein